MIDVRIWGKRSESSGHTVTGEEDCQGRAGSKGRGYVCPEIGVPMADEPAIDDTQVFAFAEETLRG